jgi:DNA-binding HxlR family transcriptional regulator
MMNDQSIHPDPTCVAAAVAILGDKWTPHLIRALSEGPLGFCALQDAAGGVNPRTLSARLDTLEVHGIVAKSDIYSLTPKGHDLLPILQSMADWGSKYSSQSTAHVA